MKWTCWAVLLALLPACAHLGVAGAEADRRTELWTQAHQALALGEFPRAEAAFARLSEEFPERDEGRESLFYLGALRLDPRNPAWDPEPAEASLRRYLALDSVGKEPVARRPEARTLLQIAAQLNLPAEERLPALQPETRVVRQRVVVPARQSRELAAEVERLRAQLAEREAQLQQQREELERIRKTLTGRKQ